MLPPLTGNNQSYIDALDRMQTEMDTLQAQVTSGYRVQTPADDPSAIGPIFDAKTRIGQLQQSQTNLGQLQTELQTGDGALQQAIQLVESASSLASQASTNFTSNSASQAALLQQAQGIMQTLVNISATNEGGRYIFSGDLDQQALYTLDPTQPNGVQQLATATSTRTVTDASGAPLWTARTATDIFDPSNPDGTPATGNVFAAVNSLITALQNNDSAGATASVSALQSADDYLNQQLGYYGIGETRVTDTMDAQSTALVNEQTQLGGLQDTDIATAAVSLTQLGNEQQAALTSRAQVSQQDLFSYLA